jgi:hypothetical protein
MASNINANNIDGFYPVAGQDNDSQGFRDNFTNTRTNFQFAADEITDLQQKVIVKAPLQGGGNIEQINNMGGQPLINFRAQDVAFTRVPLGNITGTQNIVYSLGSYQTLNTAGNVTLNFIDWPDANLVGEVNISVFANAAHTLTLTSLQRWENVTGTQGANIVGNTSAVINFPTTGEYTFTVSTDDGGNTLKLSEVNKQIQPFNNSVEAANIAASNVVSVGTTVSVFDTTDGNLATLAAGVAGQVKILAAANVAAGNLEITVTNPAWTGSGTVEFYGQGQTATFYYANSKWFCIGTGPDATGNIAKFS